jgi:acyl carrier protein
MENDQIIAGLIPIFHSLFEDEQLRITPATTRGDIIAWDSMANITLAIEMEGQFGIRVKPAEMAEVQSVGDLVSLIAARFVPART